jgi:group I intron endonuclease
MLKIYRIYKCTNKINGKTYIGFTNKKLEKRIIEHISSANTNSKYLLHKAIRKYGVDVFHWETILESLDKNYLLSEMENYFILESNSYFEEGYGYNMTFGGQGGMLGKKHSENTLNKLKIARKNRKVEPMLGKKHSDISKQKMSLAKLGKTKSDEYKQTCSERNKKRYSDPEKRKILSEAIKLMWQKRKLQQLGVQN